MNARAKNLQQRETFIVLHSQFFHGERVKYESGYEVSGITGSKENNLILIFNSGYISKQQIAVPRSFALNIKFSINAILDQF